MKIEDHEYKLKALIPINYANITATLDVAELRSLNPSKLCKHYNNA